MASQTTQWILELVDKITSPMKGIGQSTEESREKADKLGDSFKKLSAIDLYALSGSMDKLRDMMGKFSAPGIAFDTQMKSVQSVTKLADEEMEKLGDSARKSAKIFGVDAAGMLESYGSVIARFGPDVAKSDEALSVMGTDIAVLSKLMKGDAVGAMDALTTAMLQYGVDLSDPIAASAEMTRMMNVMAAAGNEGASEVGDTAEALKNAGVQALNANVSFEQTNSALQALAQGGLYGAEAGVKLRNVLAKMSGEDVIPKEAADKLRALGVNYDVVSDKTIPFTDRLRELKKAQGDATIMAQIFGIQNDAAAQILLNSVDAQDELTQKITGTNAAVESADIVMGSYEERMGRMKAWFSDLGISIFSATEKVLPFVDSLAGAVSMMADLSNARKGVLLLFNTLRNIPVLGTVVNGAFNLMSLGAKGLGVAIMNIPLVGWIAAAIAGIIALGTYFWNTSAQFRSILTGVWEAVKAVFGGIGHFIGEVFGAIWHLIKGVFNPANWFDENYHFSDAFDRIGNAAKEYGENIGKAFSEGREKGMESFYEAHPDKRPANAGATSADAKDTTGQSTNLNKTASPIITPKPLPVSNSNRQSELSGSGASGVKSITQNIEIKNYFNTDGKTDINAIAERIVRIVNEKLRDATTLAF
ncbi:hypothetical protein EZS27_005328 [termite gut metagenome]|uniref:Phage tail tape measure protein domain-containing protein n=1 Tax=termite gut metagenome TaxID=433724 RepID=A0A5J4SLX5_9ZZZZ